VILIRSAELATNAVKYGALSNAAGAILIGWTMETAPAGKRLLLSWEEKGGPPVKAPTRKGFGSRVLERVLAHELRHGASGLPAGRTYLHDVHSLTKRCPWIICFLIGRSSLSRMKCWFLS
jgi:hypothetical protein